MDKNLLDSIVVETVKNVMGHIDINGDATITHETMAQWLGVVAINDHYYMMVQRVKKVLKRHFGVFLVVEHGHGYKAVKKGEEVDVCVGTIERGKRMIHRGFVDTSYINIKGIIDEDKRNKTIEKTQVIFNLDLMIRNGERIDDKKKPGSGYTNPLLQIPGYIN